MRVVVAARPRILRKAWIGFVTGALTVGALLAAEQAEAQEPSVCLSPNPKDWPAPSKPYFMVAFDTSGSMDFNMGSGSSCNYTSAPVEFPIGTAPNNTRLSHGRCALRTWKFSVANSV